MDGYSTRQSKEEIIKRHWLPNLTGYKIILLILITITLAALASPGAGHPAPGDIATAANQAFHGAPGRAAPLYPDTGYYPSIAIGSDGQPVMSYYDKENAAIKVARCGATACSKNNTFTTVVAGAADPRSTAIQSGADGLPVFSYLEGSTTLMLVHCGNLDCTAGNHFAAVDTDSVNLSMAEHTLTIGADGLPIIAYNRDNGVLHVAHCGNADCSAGNTITAIEPPAGFFYRNYQIAIGPDHLPMISLFQLGGAYILTILHCGDASCASGNTFYPVDTMFDGRGDIAFGADGLPVIAYLGSNSVLKVAHCADLACSSGTTITTLEAGTDHPSIAISSDGLPILAYTGVLGQLKAIHCGDAACTSGNTTTRLDRLYTHDLSLAIGADGFPVIAFHNYGFLKTAHCSNPACAGGAVTSVIDSSGNWIQAGYLPLVDKGPSPNTFVVLDDPVLPGTHPAVVFGADYLPILTYSDFATQGVKVAHCGTNDCSDGNGITLLAEQAYAPSIAMGADGLALIGYTLMGTQFNLFQCTDPACTSGNILYTASREMQVMVGSDGLPLLLSLFIVGYPDNYYVFSLVHCGDMICSSGNQGVSFNSWGYRVAIGSDGFPVIMIADYQLDTRITNLSVVHCQDVACASWSKTVMLEDILENTGLTSVGWIAIGADGFPVLGYRYMNDAQRGFTLLRCGDIACTAGNTTTDLDSIYPVADIAIGSDGLPILSHQGSAGELKIFHCGDPACTSGNTDYILDQDAAADIEIAIGIDGLPLLSYVRGPYELIIAHCGDVRCSTALLK